MKKTDSPKKVDASEPEYFIDPKKITARPDNRPKK